MKLYQLPFALLQKTSTGFLPLGFSASGVQASYGKGKSNTDSVTQHNSHVGSGGLTIIESGGTTTIAGAQVTGNRVEIDAADLNIVSLQDTSKSHSDQFDASLQVTVGYGFSASGSLAMSKSNADYASVNEQSGIIAGDGGYKVNVKNHTNMVGGIVTSSQAAEDAGLNSFSTGTLTASDVENHADYSASGFSVGGGISMNGTGENTNKMTPQNKGSTNATTGQLNQGKASLSANKSFGIGSDSDHDNSTTASGINTRNITITDTAGQAATGKSVDQIKADVATNVVTDTVDANSGHIDNNYDAQAVQDEINLQVKVSQKFDQNRQEVKKDFYASVAEKRKQANDIRKENGGHETDESKRIDAEAARLYEAARWVDAGLGAVWGVGDSTAFWGMFGTTQADRARMSAIAPKEMWYQTCGPEKTNCTHRQIWSLDDLTVEERERIKADKGLLTVSNPGILNDREASLANAVKQNTAETNEKGIVVVMNPPTGNYAGKWIFSTMISELMYTGYDKLNDLTGSRLPLTNSEKLNQDLYQQADNNGWTVETSNHSRGGITASVALTNMNNVLGIRNVPIVKGRFYGTATNVQDYANQLRMNGFSSVGAGGLTYQSGAYSSVHQADFVGRPIGGNASTGGTCWLCYSHSSYYAEVPTQYLTNAQGQYVDGDNNIVAESERRNTKEYNDFIKKWGIPKNGTNPSSPVLVKPTNSKVGDSYNADPF